MMLQPITTQQKFNPKKTINKGSERDQVLQSEDIK